MRGSPGFPLGRSSFETPKRSSDYLGNGGLPPLSPCPSIAGPSGAVSAALLEQRKLLAHIVTLVTLSLVAAPVVLGWQLGRDPDVRFWIGRDWFLGSVFVTLFIVVMHFLHLVHLLAGGRSRIFMVIAAPVSFLLLCIVGLFFMRGASDLTVEHFSEECPHPALPDEARSLQGAYDEAHTILRTCEQRLRQVHGRGFVSQHRVLTLQMCKEWAMHLGVEADITHMFRGSPGWGEWTGGLKRLLPLAWWEGDEEKRSKRDEKLWGEAEWRYLAAIETNHACSGFCAGGRQLWNKPVFPREEEQRCAPVVALKLRRVALQGGMMFLTALAGLIVFVAMYLSAGSVFSRAGYNT